MVAPAALLVVFATVGGVEVFDRTSFAMIGLAARRPGWATWAGGALAFWATTAIAVVLGTLLIALVGGELRYIEGAGGLVLVGYALHLLRSKPEAPRLPSGRSDLLAAFGLIFLLELGDTTMILTVLFTGSLRDPVGVYLAAATGLTLTAAFAATVGARLGARLDERRLERFVAGLLLAVGAVALLWALLPGLFSGLPV